MMVTNMSFLLSLVFSKLKLKLIEGGCKVHKIIFDIFNEKQAISDEH